MIIILFPILSFATNTIPFPLSFAYPPVTLTFLFPSPLFRLSCISLFSRLSNSFLYSHSSLLYSHILSPLLLSSVEFVHASMHFLAFPISFTISVIPSLPPLTLPPLLSHKSWMPRVDLDEKSHQVTFKKCELLSHTRPP